MARKREEQEQEKVEGNIVRYVSSSLLWKLRLHIVLSDNTMSV